MPEHIPDLELSWFTHDLHSITPVRRAEIERHATACAQCGARLDFYAVADLDLKDPVVWRGASAASALTAYARRCESEDVEAEALLRPYFESPPKAAWTNLANRREFRNGGIVRRLNARAHALTEDAPLAALTFADLAQLIADMLPSDAYPGNAVYELRGPLGRSVHGHSFNSESIPRRWILCTARSQHMRI